jgi:hypothetical protein
MTPLSDDRRNLSNPAEAQRRIDGYWNDRHRRGVEWRPAVRVPEP